MTVRRKFNRRRHGSGTARLLFLLLVFAIIAVFVWVGGSRVLPVMADNSYQSGFFTLPGREEIFMRLLAQVIPGIGQSASASGQVRRQSAEELLTGMEWLDPRDLRTLFSMQIPYLAEAGTRPENLLHRDEGAAEEEDNQMPRIIVPAQTPPRVDRGRVIIYHTHTTESFVPTSGERFTENLELSVARVGEELSRLLERDYNLTVVHDRQIHDRVRRTSYEVALETLSTLLKTYPDAALVIDLHRDGVNRKITTAQINGQNVGRVLFVVGSRHPRWQENSSKAFILHEALEQLAPGISRGVRERPLVYNQHLHPSALLIEVGGHENSLEEVMRTLPHLAAALAGLFE